MGDAMFGLSFSSAPNPPTVRVARLSTALPCSTLFCPAPNYARKSRTSFNTGYRGGGDCGKRSPRCVSQSQRLQNKNGDTAYVKTP